ncbi:GL26770 [Drosophila persimilis]|uniref:GL26770 n=1 Tax=Drosophila persimilis TaxID=7234 RepID=B4H2L1_DROPE|nr:GL26770 [Drosophila persimilis]
MYFEIFQSELESICHKCNEVIAERIITALGKSWHPDHFACKDCQLPITEATFNIQSGEPVCSDCFVKNYSGTCFGCKQPILERTINAMEKSWPRGVLPVQWPLQKAAGWHFLLRAGKGIPTAGRTLSSCSPPDAPGCEQPITDNAIVALSAKWHRSCFKCKNCSAPITASSFAVEGNKPLCSACSG